jgi:hypothetical protein
MNDRNPHRAMAWVAMILIGLALWILGLVIARGVGALP